MRVGGSTGLLAALVAMTACGGAESGRPADVSFPDGFDVDVVVDGLVGPTQITEAPDGRLLVAQLNGREGRPTGQILSIDADDPADRVVVFDGLTSATGVAVVGDEIWVMERRRLSRGPLAGGELTTVLDELPFNGRSEGTLTATDDGRLLYDTSGTISGTSAAEGSGILWALTPDEAPEPLARGFKHAYARTYDADGTLWQTEMSDGRYDGEAAPDELVAVEPGDDFGWPKCIGDRVPVEFYGGNEERCRSGPPSHALFQPGATPTSVAVAPWDPDVLLVALWNRGAVVAVPRVGGVRPVTHSTFLTGIDHPQHLLADGDRLLVVDHGGGRILSVAPND